MFLVYNFVCNSGDSCIVQNYTKQTYVPFRRLYILYKDISMMSSSHYEAYFLQTESWRTIDIRYAINSCHPLK